MLTDHVIEMSAKQSPTPARPHALPESPALGMLGHTVPQTQCHWWLHPSRLRPLLRAAASALSTCDAIAAALAQPGTSTRHRAIQICRYRRVRLCKYNSISTVHLHSQTCAEVCTWNVVGSYAVGMRSVLSPSRILRTHIVYMSCLYSA